MPGKQATVYGSPSSPSLKATDSTAIWLTVSRQRSNVSATCTTAHPCPKYTAHFTTSASVCRLGGTHDRHSPVTIPATWTA